MNKETQTKEPEVKIFGQQAETCGRRRHGGCIVSGLLVIFVGVALLLNYADLLSWQIWSYVWPFWPVLLILAGIRLLLGNGWIARFVMFLLALAVFSAIAVYGLEKLDSELLIYVPHSVIDAVNTIANNASNIK